MTPFRDSADRVQYPLSSQLRHVHKQQQAMLTVHTRVFGSFLTNKLIRSLFLRNAMIARYATQRRSAACQIGPSSPAQRVVLTDKAC
jgi:hypothetical protein